MVPTASRLAVIGSRPHFPQARNRVVVVAFAALALRRRSVRAFAVSRGRIVGQRGKRFVQVVSKSDGVKKTSKSIGKRPDSARKSSAQRPQHARRKPAAAGSAPKCSRAR
jgi:hypothetical protein